MVDDLYQEVILDHFRHPRCSGCLAQPDCSAALFNPLCGDQINLTLNVKNDLVEKIGFAGQGCSISQASASMMGEVCEGKPVAEVRRLQQQFLALMRGEKSADDVPDLGDASILEGVRRYSARVKCAVLAWEALDKCLGQVVDPAA